MSDKYDYTKLEIERDKMKSYWDEKARIDARWWTWSNKTTEDEYFKSGAEWIENYVKKYFPVNKHKSLEIGCGIGRVTTALAKYFESVKGLDISEEMIKRANEYKEKLGIKNIEYSSDVSLLSLSRDIDFIFTLTVFQHMHHEIWWQYVKDSYSALIAGGRFYMHALLDPDDNDEKNLIDIGYKIIAKEYEGRCSIFILEK